MGRAIKQLSNDGGGLCDAPISPLLMAMSSRRRRLLTGDRLASELGRKFASIFVDNEGAFDKASFLSMGRAPQKPGVEPTLTVWIASMLNNRTVHVSTNLLSTVTTVVVCRHIHSAACWWMTCYPIFGRRVSTLRATPMILP
ncbi:hypothetical protein Trydic_g10919 [Trypoxylus dichotomus]